MSLIAAPDPGWPAAAAAEADRWRACLAEGLVAIHHVGSTAVPGLPARPALDLLVEFATLDACDRARQKIESLGYEWLGEHGQPGRRLARRDDPETGQRLVQVCCLASGDTGIAGQLAFRDVLRANAALRVAYSSVKGACAARHPEGGDEYDKCKSGWIDKVEAQALAHMT